MSIEIICPACDAKFQVRDAAAGNQFRCRTCGESIPVPFPQAKTVFDDADDEVQRAQEAKSHLKLSAARRIALKTRNRELAQTIAGMTPAAAIKVFQGTAFFCAAIIGVLVVRNANFKAGNVQRRNVPQAAMEAGGANPVVQIREESKTLFPVIHVHSPDFGEMRGLLRSPKSGTAYYEMQGTPRRGQDAPGSEMKLRVYLPREGAGPRTLGCVLVGPAGTNLLTGQSLGEIDYEAETVPYVQAGFVVVHFSLDGVFDAKQNNALELSSAYRKFSAAYAGLANASNALEFVLMRVPEVDPRRIYIAGHSSAGTLALLLAEHDPRLAGCIAYAPASDVDQRLKEVVNHPGVADLLPGVAVFASRSSPQTHVGTLSCPVFLFHGRGDTVVPVAQSDQFAASATALGKLVEYKEVVDGDHYDAMVSQGIPLAIAWLKKQPREVEAALAVPAGGEGPPQVPAKVSP